MMKHLNLILSIISLIVWAALYVVYYKGKILPWIANRFVRDKRPGKGKIKNGYFPDGAPIPFRENLYPSGTASKEGATPGEGEAEDSAAQNNNREKDNNRP